MIVALAPAKRAFELDQHIKTNDQSNMVVVGVSPTIFQVHMGRGRMQALCDMLADDRCKQYL